MLRLANIFGYERGPGRRTFLSLTLDRLAREGRIRFDMSPFVERDFLPVEACARLLARIVAGAARRRAQRRLRHRRCRPDASRSGCSKAMAAASW